MLTILLPPSEGKAPGGGDDGWRPDDGRFGEILGARRGKVASALKRAGGGNGRLLGVRGETLARAVAANRALVGAPTLPAWQRFTGVVWGHLDVGSLRGTARRRAMRSVLVVSALGGISALDDPLPDFRLKLSASLPPLGGLAVWWRPAVTEQLDRVLARRLVVDLLPQEHAAAWAPRPDIDRRRVRFVGHDGRTVGHTAKAAKGLLARALLETSDPEDVLASWTHPEIRIEVEGPAGAEGHVGPGAGAPATGGVTAAPATGRRAGSGEGRAAAPEPATASTGPATSSPTRRPQPAAPARTSADTAPATTGARDRTALEAAIVAVLDALQPGDVVTYGEVAIEAGYPGRARAVGAVLAGSDGAHPWWRVVNASGRLVPGHEEEQARRLAAEGVTLRNGRVPVRR